jgi:hypothetical protein
VVLPVVGIASDIFNRETEDPKTSGGEEGSLVTLAASSRANLHSPFRAGGVGCNLKEAGAIEALAHDSTRDGSAASQAWGSNEERKSAKKSSLFVKCTLGKKR